MKFSCNTKELYKALALVKGFAGKTGGVYLPDIRFLTLDGAIRLSATDLEQGISYVVPAAVSAPGAAVLAADKVVDIVSMWGDDVIEFSAADGKRCVLQKDSDFFHIMCAMPESFPNIPEPEGKCIAVDPGIFADAIRKVIFIVKGDSSGGVFIRAENRNLFVVANDGRRLAEVTVKISNKENVAEECVVSARGIAQILKTIKDAEGEVYLYFNKTRLSARTKHAVVVTQLLEGRYPDYRKAIPKSLGSEAGIDREDFLSAVSRAAVMTTDDYRRVRFEFSGLQTTISCVSPDVGTSQVTCGAVFTGQGTFVLHLNPYFVIDYLKSLDVHAIKLKLADEHTACVFRTSGYQYLLMPMSGEGT